MIWRANTATAKASMLAAVSFRLRIILAAAVVLAPAGCNQAESAPASGTTISATPRTFREVYQQVDSVLLEQPDSAPIVRISGIDLAADGRILLGDVSEGNVKIFARNGTLLRVLGRKGGGPGEFTSPRYPRFGPDGRVYVADAQDPRIQVFDSTGDRAKVIRLPDLGMVQGFQPLATGNLLILAASEARTSVLVEIDTAGRQVKEFLQIGEVRPTGQPAHTLWRNVNAYSLDVSGDTAFVSNTLSDSVWTVHLPTGREQRTQLAFEGYIHPAPPRQMPPDIPALLKWGRGFHQSSTITAVNGAVALPYVQGVLNNGDPMLLLTRTAAGWMVSPDAPPIIGGGNGRLIGLLTPGSEIIRLGVFTPVRQGK